MTHLKFLPLFGLLIAGCAPMAPSCAVLLECLDATASVELDAWQDRVGRTSDCWDGPFAEASCDAQCWDVLAELEPATAEPACAYEERANYTHVAAKTFMVGTSDWAVTFGGEDGDGGSFTQSGCEIGDAAALVGCAPTGHWLIDGGVLTVTSDEGFSETGELVRTPATVSVLEWSRESGDVVELVRVP